jgi:EAL domain-containing protein (putative c-di-GMP-specific phosphodiesterase class I)/GGDEF domain-containing protein
MAVNGERNVDKLKVQSIHEYYNPATIGALREIDKFIRSLSSPQVVIVAFSIENMATILFKHGPTIVREIAEEFINIIKSNITNSIAHRISIEEFICCFPYENKDHVYATIQHIIDDSRRYAASMPQCDIYMVIKAGSVILEEKEAVEDAFSKAYMALYDCRVRQGETHTLCSDIEAKIIHSQNYMELAAYFQRAALEERLRLAFQPIVDSKTGKVKNYECLLRILTKDGDIISAGPFIPIAESMGFIDQIDSIVLGMVVEELKKSPKIELGVNISNLSIENSSWLRKAKQLLSDPAVANRLTIEITETGMHKDLDQVAAFVEEMQALGCLIAIDDFGTGYTSFQQIKVINVDIIKIDGIFIRDIVNNPDSKLFVKTMLNFARGFGIKAVAEYVENSETAKALMELEIDYMQGHYFSPAVQERLWEKDEEVF